jgi:hypothetical protein
LDTFVFPVLEITKSNPNDDVPVSRDRVTFGLLLQTQFTAPVFGVGGRGTEDAVE